MTPVFFKVASRLVRWLDPRLQKYRKETPATLYTPESEEELIKLLRRTPTVVLGKNERKLIAGAMSFFDAPVSSIMTPRPAMRLLSDKDFLGPLLLDKLYKSGAKSFVVLDKKQQICGILNTNSFNPLSVAEDTPISEYMQPTVFYIRADYSLEMALSAFLRTSATLLVVIDRDAKMLGSLDFSRLIEKLFGREVFDSFDRDTSLEAVASR